MMEGGQSVPRRIDFHLTVKCMSSGNQVQIGRFSLPLRKITTQHMAVKVAERVPFGSQPNQQMIETLLSAAVGSTSSLEAAHKPIVMKISNDNRVVTNIEWTEMTTNDKAPSCSVLIQLPHYVFSGPIADMVLALDNVTEKCMADAAGTMSISTPTDSTDSTTTSAADVVAASETTKTFPQAVDTPSSSINEHTVGCEKSVMPPPNKPTPPPRPPPPVRQPQTITESSSTPNCPTPIQLVLVESSFNGNAQADDSDYQGTSTAGGESDTDVGGYTDIDTGVEDSEPDTDPIRKEFVLEESAIAFMDQEEMSQSTRRRYLMRTHIAEESLHAPDPPTIPAENPNDPLSWLTCTGFDVKNVVDAGYKELCTYKSDELIPNIIDEMTTQNLINRENYDIYFNYSFYYVSLLPSGNRSIEWRPGAFKWTYTCRDIMSGLKKYAKMAVQGLILPLEHKRRELSLDKVQFASYIHKILGLSFWRQHKWFMSPGYTAQDAKIPPFSAVVGYGSRGGDIKTPRGMWTYKWHRDTKKDEPKKQSERKKSVLSFRMRGNRSDKGVKKAYDHKETTEKQLIKRPELADHLASVRCCSDFFIII